MSTLRRLRTDKRLSAKDLAKASGVSLAQIYCLENGKTKQPQLQTLIRLADVLDCNPSDLDPIVQASGGAA